MSAVVLDASAVVDAVLGRRAPHIQRALQGPLAPRELVTLPHLDAEVLSAFARMHRAGELTVTAVHGALEGLAALPVERLPVGEALLRTAWGMRDNVAMRDALYLAAALHLGGKVLTTDERLRRAAPHLTVGPVEQN